MMILSGILFVGVAITVRYVGTRIPAPEAAFIRYFVGFLLMIPFMLTARISASELSAWRVLTIRGILHGIGVVLWFFAMARLSIAEVTALGYLTPVLMTIGAAVFFGERVFIRRILAIFFGLVGVFIILRPGFSPISAGQIAQVLAAPLFAASMLLTKKLTDTTSTSVIVAALSIVCTIVLLPMALLDWVQPNQYEILLLSLTAVFATAGHYALTKSLALAPISVIQPASFLQLIWATMFGYILFGDLIDGYVILGGAILIASVSYIAHRESIEKS